LIPSVDQPELFSALLTPHRSLNRTGFLVLMAFLSASASRPASRFC
jgi:uncharacterized membrane protein